MAKNTIFNFCGRIHEADDGNLDETASNIVVERLEAFKNLSNAYILKHSRTPFPDLSSFNLPSIPPPEDYFEMKIVSSIGS